MGHIGTLDPLASGLILIATEQSTKLLSYINNDKKSYFFRVELGWKTESLDLETEIQEVDISNLNIPEKHILEQKILDTEEQIPPKFSAIHIDGKRAYKLARKNRDFDIPTRPIQVFDIKIIHIGELNIDIWLTLSSGWYIRSFAPLIADWCNIDGGYISILQREKLYFWKNFLTLDDAQDLENFDPKKTISEKILLPEFDEFFTENEEFLIKIKNGIIPDDEFFKKISQNLSDWQKFFINFNNKYSSIFSFIKGKIEIVRNDIRTHK